MNPIVYKISFPNDKLYFGITSRGLDYRKYEHETRARTGHGHYVHSALRKYGSDVKWEVVEELTSYEQAKEREKYWISLHKSDQKRFGYNLTKGGDGTVGCLASEETRKKLSEAHKGYKMPESQKLKIRQANIGRPKKNSRCIYGYNETTREGIFLTSQIFIEKYTTFGRMTVLAVCAGRRNSAFGWKFMYLEQ